MCQNQHKLFLKNRLQDASLPGNLLSKTFVIFEIQMLHFDSVNYRKDEIKLRNKKEEDERRKRGDTFKDIKKYW